ncbi:MAG TPA: PQQ-binding-like beta-propeller repeat protein, partial [Kofleriaceae bacterium]|nr:PQQ-binding-like beta-propeller repeat protein [Kofleriaceae bacterium]
ADRLVEGLVYVDADRSGTPGGGEAAVAGALVVWVTTAFATTDAHGRFALRAPDGPGMIWVRTPDGFEPTPVWSDVPEGGDRAIDLGLHPAAASGPLRFVQASDSHVGGTGVADPAGDLAGVLEQAIDLDPPPHFITITGDLSQSNLPEELTAVRDVALGLDVPFVPVPGNHDWYDGGLAYRLLFGPPNYSFDAGGVHVIVLNDSGPVEERLHFLAEDVAHLGPRRPIIALTHAPPVPEIVDALENAGVAALFTGHIHSNRVLRHDALFEMTVEPAAMGGLDLTPAGFRVIAVDADGTIAESHHTVIEAPQARLVHPDPHDCAGGELIASVAVGAARPHVRAHIGDAVIDLPWKGGWAYAAPLSAHADEALLEVVPGTGTPLLIPQRLGGLTCDGSGLELDDWSQLQGGPEHTGSRAHEIEPPLLVAWARPAGDHVLGGSPVVAGGRLFVPLGDLGDGSRGGVLALDAATGAQRWRYRLGEGLEPLVTAQYGAPAIAGGRVYVGVQREFVALDLRTGAPLWSDVPLEHSGFFGSHASPAVGGDLVVGSFARGGQGAFAWSAAAGLQRWQSEPDVTEGMHAAPLIAGGAVFLINELTEVRAFDLAGGLPRWTVQLDPAAFEWGNHVTGEAAWADGTLFVPTQPGAVDAVDAATGARLWHAGLGAGSPIRPSHYRGPQNAASAVAVAGSLVWVGGADGRLRALDAARGGEVWSIDLGAPILAG